MVGVLIVYGAMFLVLGFIGAIVLRKPPYDEKAGLRRARIKRARENGYLKARVQVDVRVRRHVVEGGYW